MKLLNIKTYTCNYTKRRLPVLPSGTLIELVMENQQVLGMVMGIYKSKPKILNNKYEYTYIIKKLV